MYKNATQQHPRHNVCAGVSGVTKDAGPASCAVVASQWAGCAVREGEVLFSVFFAGARVCTTRATGNVQISSDIT